MKKRKQKKAPAKKRSAAPKVDIQAMKYETVSTWASEINAAYQRYLDTGEARWRAIIETGNKLIDAKAAMNAREWFTAFDAKKIEKPIQMSTSYAERFMAIADHPVLKNPDNCLFLPPTVSGLYALWQLDEKAPGTVARVLTEGKLSADMTVVEIQALLPQDETKKDTASSSSPQPTTRPMSEKAQAQAFRLEQDRLFIKAEREALQMDQILPEARCRLCNVEYVTNDKSLSSIGHWIRTHIQLCHSKDDIAVTFLLDRADEVTSRIASANWGWIKSGGSGVWGKLGLAREAQPQYGAGAPIETPAEGKDEPQAEPPAAAAA